MTEKSYPVNSFSDTTGTYYLNRRLRKGFEGKNIIWGEGDSRHF